MTRARHAAVAAVLAGAIVAAAGIAAADPVPAPVPIPDAPALKRTIVLKGLEHPWDLAFTPDGHMLVNQRIGVIGVKDGHELRPLRTLADVQVGGDSGLMGLAVDPDFATNRWIYVCLSSTRGATDDLPADNRVVRFTVDDDYTRLSERRPVITGIEFGREYLTYGAIHQGCRIRFGPDGYLWVTMGDAVNGPVPQDPASLNGKILRVDRDGNPAPGNAAEVLADPSFDPRIYTFGHRNPQGIAFRPGADPMQVFTAEHGHDTNDEVNKLCSGCNYGWDPVFPPDDPQMRYLLPPPGNWNPTVPMTDLTKFPDAETAVWRSGDDATLAPSGIAFLSGDQWGSYNGALAVAFLKARHLRILTLSADGLTVPGQDMRLEGPKRRLRSPVLGPNGKLYITTDEPYPGDHRSGQVWKVSPRPS